MPVVQGRELPADKEVFDVSGQFERVAVGHDEVGELALLEGPDLAVETEHPRGIQRDGLERFLIRQAVRDGVRGVLSQPPREGVIETREVEFHTRSSKLRRLRKPPIVRIVLIARKRQHWPEDYGNGFRTEEVLNLIRLQGASE